MIDTDFAAGLASTREAADRGTSAIYEPVRQWLFDYTPESHRRRVPPKLKRCGFVA